MVLRPWHPIPIVDCGEPLLPLPATLLRLEPHPYVAVGAPYGPGQCPFQLRQGVLHRLLQAQDRLQQHQPSWRLAIMDGWRPLAVQRHMVTRAIAEQCRIQGVDPDVASPQLAAIEAVVGRFWAPPSDDPDAPPPHSTGAAVDLTLATASGGELAMGGAIDAIGAVSEPDHYAQSALMSPEGPEAQWHNRRLLLQSAMASVGFCQHPNEWWHFSWGDQLWAWRGGHRHACYGRVDT